ncbi:MAG: hypothetical protein AB8G77_14565 [Rhodothermales bacterium]
MTKKNDNTYTSNSLNRFTRRHFMHTTLGGAFILGLSSCDQVEDSVETYMGPEINELEFVTFNRQYHDISIDAATQFPHNAIRGGANSGITDPVAIAYRLQQLIDIADATTAEALIDNLLVAQENSITFIDYKGFIPNLEFANTNAGFLKSEAEFSIPDNAILSARVAMAASAFSGTPIADKAMLFLANQKEGYNFYLSGTSLAFPETGSALNSDIGEPKVEYLFSGYYTELAFVLSYFIGDSATIQDPQVGMDAWNALISAPGIPTAQHGDSFTALTTLTVPLAKNGSAYQYFQSLLALPTASISQSMSDALYNVLFSFLDAARFENLPGIYSGAPNAQGNFLSDNGLSRLTVPANATTSRESIATVDALAAALRLFPAESLERQAIRRWIGVFDATPGIKGASGLFGGVDKSGNVSESYYARQNAAMILFDSTAPSHLESFLIANSKTSLADMFSRIAFSQDGLPVQRVPGDLPLPPPLAQIFPTTPEDDTTG